MFRVLNVIGPISLSLFWKSVAAPTRAQPSEGWWLCALKGRNPDGPAVFEGDIIPTRSEKEQADYVLRQPNLLSEANANGVLMYVFSFPCGAEKERETLT
jgi:hypothetical protein